MIKNTYGNNLSQGGANHQESLTPILSMSRHFCMISTSESFNLIKEFNYLQLKPIETCTSLGRESIYTITLNGLVARVLKNSFDPRVTVKNSQCF